MQCILIITLPTSVSYIHDEVTIAGSEQLSSAALQQYAWLLAELQLPGAAQKGLEAVHSASSHAACGQALQHLQLMCCTRQASLMAPAPGGSLRTAVLSAGHEEAFRLMAWGWWEHRELQDRDGSTSLPSTCNGCRVLMQWELQTGQKPSRRCWPCSQPQLVTPTYGCTCCHCCRPCCSRTASSQPNCSGWPFKSRWLLCHC